MLFDVQQAKRTLRFVPMDLGFAILLRRAQNADFCRKPQILALSPGNSSIWSAQETAGFRRAPKIFKEKHKKPQIGLRHLRSVTFTSAPEGSSAGGGISSPLVG